MDIHLLSPIEADVMVWTAAGLVTLVLMTKKFGWVEIVSSLIVAELTMIGFIVPIMTQQGFGPGWYRPMGFFIGAGGSYLWGAIIKFLEKLSEDPQGTVERAWRLWRGQGGEQ